MKLHDYQETAAQFVTEQPNGRGCALWLDMGVGKTAITIEAMKRLEWDGLGRTLIIGPKRVAERVWPRELKKWKAPFSFEVFLDDDRRATEMLVGGKDVCIINRENVPWLCNEMRDRWPFDTVVIDEASSFKHSSSQRWKGLKKWHTGRTIELTGTPGDYLALWSQVYLIDRGERLGPSFSAYKLNFFDAILPKNANTSGKVYPTYVLKPGAKEEIDRRLRDICLSMSIDQGLPAETYNPIEVSLTTAQRRQYKELEEELFLALDAGDVSAVNAAVVSGKLRQFCNGALYLDNVSGPKDWAKVHEHKIDAVESLLEETGEPVLLAYQFQSDLERLRARFGDRMAHPDDKFALDRFEAGELELLATHPESIGHGVDGLQQNSRYIAWMGLPWSLEQYLQFNARLQRQGQTKPVFIHHIMVERSIEQRMLAALRRHGATMQGLLDAVKADLNKRWRK